MIFEQIATGGCQSYLIGCEGSRKAAVIDPELSQIDRYLGLAARAGLRLHYAIDTHTHADHFSAARELKERFNVPAVAGLECPSPYVSLRLGDDELLIVGGLKIRAMPTPGHTRDSMCLVCEDRVFTGDTLLIGGTGRTDLPTGDPEQLFESLFGRLLQLAPETLVFPAHDYKGRSSSTIGAELADNPRLKKRDRADFVEMMNQLNLSAPTHLTEALRTNLHGGRTVAQMMAEATATTPFVGMAQLARLVEARSNSLIVLDVREKEQFAEGHIPGAMHLPRGQLELRVDEALPDPTRRIVTCCEFGRISTLAAATLRTMGFIHAAALDGGMKAWREAGLPMEA
jgi:glyoxylase-like metal-dependent hydrolase (beta-lactamase superfamily II)/rhodanese-related sulfurtransferase